MGRRDIENFPMTRVALAPIKDSHLNSSNPGTPLRKPVKAAVTPLKLLYRPGSMKGKFKLPRLERAELAAGVLKRKLQVAAIRLQQQQQPRATKLPLPLPTCLGGPKITLSTIARRRLRFFRVKQTLTYYQPPPQKLPLAGTRVQLPRILCADQQSFILPYAAAVAGNSLPSINIILKTPIKNSRRATPAEDTTIDDEDTIANVTVDDAKPARRPLLTLLPIQGHMGTPNSFLVAKLLLQLAGNVTT